MRERPEQIVKYVCMGLGALLFIRFVWIIWTANPLARVVVPDLPSLADDSQTNVSPSAISGKQPGTNQATLKTNSVTATKVQPPLKIAPTTAGSGTNESASQAGNGTNAAAPLVEGAGPPKHRRHGQFGGAMAMGSMPGAKKTTVSPVIQASIDRITDSEILGPVIRPLPMALLGIAGDEAFLRGPDGQTGLEKEGDTLGDIKLLRIGINRVLIEEDGQQKELTIFDGIGGETLLDKPSQDSNENKKP
jgi:hypothetical protein